ncbi:EAL domain-containing protein [Sphingomonas sp. PL-96]|uniref:putative bifunctional diguanylate cyclase/phosphodiesterase n=1 Tax=Sphingomonas sp. PL-96 TaxID=2887201 RepID=UPI001E3D9BF5|nr:EAL domain-containing protein [Sphingomonas sp. PL-96]MCC2977342.1 EAL domain-containing protein [Sphingomonas sp. PL-96]
MAATALLIAALAFLSARQSDSLAFQREHRVMETVLAQSIARIAHDQEGVTVWDDAVRQVRAPDRSVAWLDNNLGLWMRTYFGHDEAYVLDPGGRALYAMRDGAHVAPDAYGKSVAPIAAPLVASLQAMLRRRAPGNLDAPTLSPGTIDLGTVNGHPAIVSVKPITSDTGRIVQVPGSEYLHVAVRYLDTGFVRDLAERYRLEQAGFSHAPPPGDRQGVPLLSSSNRLLGYVTWLPFRPGSLMVRRVAPIMVAALLLIFAIVAVLLGNIRRSTLRLEASEAQAQHLAFHDPLTGLANRALFDDRLAFHLAQARAAPTSLALLYLDLDGFKQVNDTLGHPAGDELIKAVAARLSASVRADDLVARIGGDEFAILQLGIDSPAAAEILCMRIIEEVSRPFDIAGTHAYVGVSMGIALGPQDAAERFELARKADIALYQAKAAGRGRYLFFADEMDASLKLRKQIETDLRGALDSCDQFEVFYQPLYSARSGTMTGAEALVRWHHPEHGTLSPSLFIPIAEETGMVEQLGAWVLDHACRAVVRWPIGTIAVNVSPVQLRNRGFAEEVLATLKRTGLPPERLELEITETNFIENAASCQPNLVRLRASGVRIALDDFGTGYSSFTHLRNFDVDRIKIDRSFVSGITNGTTGSPIIQAIIDLAKASGLKVTAEGVETPEQRVFLSRIGCNSLQGFLLSHPLPAGAMDASFGLAPVRPPQPTA